MLRALRWWRCSVPCHCTCQQQEQPPVPPQGTQTHRHGLKLCRSVGSSWALCALGPCRGAAPLLRSHTAVPPVRGWWLGALSSACAAGSDAAGDTAVGLPVLGVHSTAHGDSVLLHRLVWDRYGAVQVGFGAAAVQLILFLQRKYSPRSTHPSVRGVLCFRGSESRRFLC